MISKFSVKKPFTIVVAVILVLILGVVSYANMSVDLMPSFNLPYVMVTTAYPGASPEEVEKAVTQPVEQSMASVSDVTEVSSISSENQSMVILEFNQNADMDAAVVEVREALDLVSAYFADGVGSSVILKLNPDMLPVMALSVSAGQGSDQESARQIEEKIMPELESVPGVASVSANGLIHNMVDVTLSGEKLEALNQKVADFYQKQAESKIRQEAEKQVTAAIDGQLQEQKAALLQQGMTEQMAAQALAPMKQKLESAAKEQVDRIVEEQLKKVEIPAIDLSAETLGALLAGQNFSMPAGSLAEGEEAGTLVRVGDEIEDIDALAAMVVTELPDYGAVTVGEIADVTAYDDHEEIYSRVNGEYAVILTLQKQPDYSTADVANSVQERMQAIGAENDGVHFSVLMNQGEYVNVMIKTILTNLLFGGLLAILILFVFLRRIKPTVIVGASIVISVVTAFVLMYFSGITLNMVSMGGLALGVGMLVDNSIVVIENIYRMRSEGLGAKEAAVAGAKEVTGAIAASTLTTIIVFVPLVFTEGITKQLFTDMALTIAFSLLASLLVALTLVPAASAAMLKAQKPHKRNFIDKMADGYVKLLDRSLNRRWVTIAVAVLLLGGSVAAAFSAGTEMFPSMDSGSVTVSVDMPEKYTEEQTFHALDQLSETLTGIDAVETVGVLHGGSSSMGMSGGTTVYVSLKEDRAQSTDAVIEEIRARTQDFDFEVSVSNSNADMTMLTGGQVSVAVYGRDLDDLRGAAAQVADAIGGVEGTTEVDNGLGKPKQEIRIRVDKEKAAAKGLTVAQVYQAVSKELAAEKSVGTITEGAVEYALYVKDAREQPATAESLEKIALTAQDGSTVTVGEVAQVARAEGFSSIRRSGQERMVSVTASLREGYRSGDVNAAVEQTLKELSLPAGCRVEIEGESEAMRQSFSDLLLVLILAIVFIYLIMVAQFQSLVSPFIVMFTIPLAFTGGFLALFLAGMPVSVVALIGLVILVGVVVNNGIVFVDYANQQRAKGMECREALLKTARNRIRPILMTALTTILALCTMAFDTSSGGELLKPMAVTTIGGLTYATFLTLFLVPAMYSLFLGRRKAKPALAEGEVANGETAEEAGTQEPPLAGKPEEQEP